jgi:hypothetical protein
MVKQNDLVKSEERTTLAQRRAFLKLPLAERRRVLFQQAEDAADHYESEQNVREREAWQGGDIVEYQSAETGAHASDDGCGYQF